MYFKHPDYDVGEGWLPNDLTVVHASEELTGENIAPGTMAPNANHPGGSGWITGWGRLCGKTF